MVTSAQKAINQARTWMHRVNGSVIEIYATDNPSATLATFGTVKDAGQAISDLKTYGHIQPRAGFDQIGGGIVQ